MLGFYVLLDLVTGVLGIETADSAAEELKKVCLNARNSMYMLTGLDRILPTPKLI